MKILTNIKFLWTVVILLIILNVVSISLFWMNEVESDNPVRPFPPRVRQHDHFLKQELNFTSEQQDQFDSLMELHRSGIEEKVEEIRLLREELMSLMRNQEFTGEAEAIIEQIGQTQSELEFMNYRHFKEVMSICNEEQKQVFLETIRRVVGPRHGIPGRMGPGDDFRRRGRRGNRN